MSEDESWRSETAYNYIDNLTPGNLAWEFLRRNPTTGKPIRSLCPAADSHSKRPKNLRTYGGCDFGADPLIAAHAQQIFWTPQVDPSAIMFAAGPRPEGFSITADELRLRTIFQHDPAHLRLDIAASSMTSRSRPAGREPARGDGHVR
jgi:hypothetical protein